jgi:hypothetical protein
VNVAQRAEHFLPFVFAQDSPHLIRVHVHTVHRVRVRESLLVNGAAKVTVTVTAERACAPHVGLQYR